MAASVAVYYDANGLVSKIVDVHHEDPTYIPANSDYLSHDDGAMARVSVSVAVYAANPPINWGGTPVYHSLTKALLPQISAANAATGMAAQTIANTIDAALTNHAQAIQAAQTAYAQFAAALTAQQQALSDAVATAPDPTIAYQALLASLTLSQSTQLSAVPPIPPLDTSLPKTAVIG